MSVEIFEIESKLLADNPLEDPTKRKLYVYLPPNFSASKPYPCLMGLAGYGGNGAGFFNNDPLGESLDQRLDRLIESGECPPVMAVLPDCFNRLGGSQYINSSAIGDYEDYLVKEIVPWIEKSFEISAWGLFGKSSGGYGSMILAMHYPEIFKGFANHSGDANFEYCYFPCFPGAWDEFHRAGGPRKWLEKFESDVNRNRRQYHKPYNILAMAAHYSPNPRSEHLGIDFPFDLETGVFVPEVWDRWREWDPVNRIDTHADALRGMRHIRIECGKRDEYALQWGARALRQKLEALKIPFTYEEFDDGHRSLSYRFDQSLPELTKALLQ